MFQKKKKRSRVHEAFTYIQQIEIYKKKYSENYLCCPSITNCKILMHLPNPSCYYDYDWYMILVYDILILN